MHRWQKVLAVVAAGIGLVASPFAAAAPSPPGGGSPGQGLEISPPVMELSANPGQTVTAVIRVRNVTPGVLIATGKADDFGAGTDENGEPKLLLNETGATRYSLKYWVKGVPDITLAPGELKTTTATIAVPADAEPGGHFGVIRFTAVPPELKGTGVALSASVGTLVLLKVSGAINEKLSVASFNAQQGGLGPNAAPKVQSFFEQGPVDFAVRIKNEGTVHEKPQGSVTVTNMFGKKVGTVAVNPRGGNVLPDSVRKYQQGLSSKRLFGYYAANMKLTYAGSRALEAKTSFWVIPWKLILLVMLGLVALFFLGRIGLRKYNERIIRKARGR